MKTQVVRCMKVNCIPESEGYTPVIVEFSDGTFAGFADGWGPYESPQEFMESAQRAENRSPFFRTPVDELRKIRDLENPLEVHENALYCV